MSAVEDGGAPIDMAGEDGEDEIMDPEDGMDGAMDDDGDMDEGPAAEYVKKEFVARPYTEG